MEMRRNRQFWIFAGAINTILSIISSYSSVIELQNWKISMLHSKWILLLSAYVFCGLAGIFLIFVASRNFEHPIVSFLELDKFSGKIWKAAGW